MKEIFWYGVQAGIDISAVWIPRELNTLADEISKFTDTSDWMMNKDIFSALNRKWGPFTTDLFGSFTNHLLPRYYSRYHTPSCAGVNAFAYDWGAHNPSWCNPPFGLISRVIKHAIRCKARICLIIPVWPRSWWHLLAPGPQFHPAVQDCVVLPHAKDLFLPGLTGNELHKRAPNWQCIAILVDFARDRLQPLSVPVTLSN